MGPRAQGTDPHMFTELFTLLMTQETEGEEEEEVWSSVRCLLLFFTLFFLFFQCVVLTFLFCTDKIANKLY